MYPLVCGLWPALIRINRYFIESRPLSPALTNQWWCVKSSHGFALEIERICVITLAFFSFWDCFQRSDKSLWTREFFKTKQCSNFPDLNIPKPLLLAQGLCVREILQFWIPSQVLRATCSANPISIDFSFETGLQMLHEESLTAEISSSVGAKGSMFKSWLSISDTSIASYIDVASLK